MLYAIPNSLTIGDSETDWNTTLSDTDKAHAASIYPWRPKSIVTLRNSTGNTVRFQYKWSRDNDWRDATISDNGRLMYCCSPKDGTFPTIDVRIDGRVSSHAANRLNPAAWRGRNYPEHEDGRAYRFQTEGTRIRLVND